MGNSGATGAFKDTEDKDDNLRLEVDILPNTKSVEPAVVVAVLASGVDPIEADGELPVFTEDESGCDSRLPRKSLLGIGPNFVSVGGGFESVLVTPDEAIPGVVFSVAASAVGCVLSPNWNGNVLLPPPGDAKLVVVEKVGRLANNEKEGVAVEVVLLVVVVVTPVTLKDDPGGFVSKVGEAFCCT